jgi:hypothetical protein
LNEPTIAQTVLFPDLADRPLIATFDQPHASSDGGAILLKAAAPRMLLAMSAALADTVIARHRRGVRLITIDVDVTEDQTHGAQ